MTTTLPSDVEHRLREVVRGGRFASFNDAMTEAARLLLELDRGGSGPSAGFADSPDPFLGSMRDAADELDQIVDDAYRSRREETWRDLGVE